MDAPTKESSILVPIDFSELALVALKQSFKFARMSNAKIILLHVMDENSTAETEEKLNKLAKEASTESGLKVEALLLKGKVYEQIIETAEKIAAKFIVMGLNSSPIGIKSVLGANSFKLIKEAQCPVITIKEKLKHDECKTIVLPLDLTKESREKVGRAVEYAKFFNASIRILSVFSPSEVNLENKLLAYTHQAKEYIKEKGVACSNKTIEASNRARIVIDYANKIEADLIIYTTQSESSLKEVFSGTASQQIVNLSNIPVMSLRPMQRKDTTSFTI